MNICPNCGASVHETAAVCPACGTPVSAANMNTAQPGMQQPYGQPGYQSQQFAQPGMPPQQYYPEDRKAEGWEILVSILVPVAGIILYFTNKDKRPTAAKTMLKCALIAWGVSFALSIFLRVVATIITNM